MSDPSNPQASSADTEGPPEVVGLPLAQMNRLVPKYTFVGVLGIGGMGVVYQAYQQTLERLVAIKLLPPELSIDPKATARFEREARAMAQLSHPNIVSVIDYGQSTEGHHFIVMEYVHGDTLSALLKERKVTLEDLLKWIPHVCDALAFAHSKGIVHRDVKPGNVMISEEGEVKMTDFGLAQFGGETLQEFSKLTNTNAAVGTLHYIAPESLDPRAKTDHRVDIFAMGVMLYEMLTGRYPVGSWLPPSSQVSGLDRRFDALVAHAMDPNPDTRLQRAGDISKALITIRDGDPDAEVLPTAVLERTSDLDGLRRAPSDAIPTRPQPKIGEGAASAEGAPERSKPLLIALVIVAAVVLVALQIFGMANLQSFFATEEGQAEPPSPIDTPESSESSVSDLEEPSPIPIVDPTDPADRPVRVVLLSGQANVDGLGELEVLQQAMADDPEAAAFTGLRDADEWITRDDVWLARSAPGSPLQILPLSPAADKSEHRTGRVGVALGAGVAIGDAIDETVVILRVSFGGGSVAKGFRPPHMQNRTYDGLQENQGNAYRYVLNGIQQALLALPDTVEPVAKNGFDVSALIWFQGWNDSLNAASARDYGENLADLMQEFRRVLASPELPIIIGEFSPGGPPPVLGRGSRPINEFQIRELQRSFPERDPFRGSSAFVETWSLHGPDFLKRRHLMYLYGRDPQTLVGIGRALGQATVPFLQEQVPVEDRSQEILTSLETALEDL